MSDEYYRDREYPSGLGFVITTNSNVPLINTAVFKNKNGETVIVDRNTTEWEVDEIDDGLYRMYMTWRWCYIWDGDEEHYMDWEYPVRNKFEFVEFELEEDDVPENYSVNVESWAWFTWGRNNGK